jgi:oxygen-independent coproporphyrinogen-3 oxidase
MVTDAIGLYVHIPFCRSKCSYCDFCSHVPRESEYAKYTDALVRQIKAYKRDERIAVGTIFFGGGTPSLLPLEYMERIMLSVREAFAVLPGAEITIEANPKTLTPEGLAMYKRLGFNRISIGAQSFHKNELKILGRIHSPEDVSEAVAMCRSAGFLNVNIDLMYGIPEQSLSSFEQSLDRAIALSPTHISCYGLMLEEGTPLYERRESLTFPGESAECEMYYLAAEKLRAAGYEHYEISNYAKDGFYSFHNLIYWHTDEYIGVGLSAHSYFGKKRYSSSPDFSEYLSDPELQYITDEDDAGGSFEYAMLALRLAEGLSLNEYKARFGASFEEGREQKLSELEAAGYLLRENGRVALTERGFYVSNSILCELL